MDDFDLGGLDLDSLNAPGFALDGLSSGDFCSSIGEGKIARFPPRQRILSPRLVKHSNAQALARDVWPLDDGEAVHCIVDGRFLYGDLIEAACVTQDMRLRELWIMTLTLTGGNIESLVNLYEGGYLVDGLHLVVSDYWFANERGSTGLLGYVLDELAHRPGFQLSTCRSHAKVTLMDLEGHGKQVIHGSANLRSSATAEQFAVERSTMLYDFYHDWLADIETQFWTVNKNAPVEGCKALPKGDQWSLIGDD